jgi:hypothetical protein
MSEPRRSRKARGRLREQGEAKERSSRLRAQAAGDLMLKRGDTNGAEPAE